MNMPFKAWLPEEAISSDAIERALREIASLWSEKWFARQTLGLIDPPTAPQVRYHTDLDGLAWRSHDEGLVVGMSEAAKTAIGRLMLDAAPRASELTAADHWLFDGLAKCCLEDLCLQLSEAFYFESTNSWLALDGAPTTGSEASIYRIGTLGGAPLVHLIVERTAAVALIRSQAGLRNREPLPPLAAALSRQHVAVSARLGSCSISLSELTELAAGDVIVLDRPLGQLLELAVDGQSTSGRCSAEAGGAKLNLKIVKPLNG